MRHCFNSAVITVCVCVAFQAHEERLCPSCAEVMGTGQEVQEEPDKGLQPASSSFTPSWSEARTELQHAVILIAVAKLAIHTMKLVG